MEHDDVVTMFHEFGHLMHHVLGGHQPWITQSGVATEWDFVEAPSQMFEEWAWSYETLARFARHHETGEVIPKELVEKMRARRQVRPRHRDRAADLLRGDLARLPPRRSRATLDQLAEVQRLQKQYTPFALRAGHAVPRVVRPPRRLLGDVLHVPVVARDREGSPDAVRAARA